MMDTVEIDLGREAQDLVWNVAVKVREYCPGSIGWIARQKHENVWSDDYCFVVGNGAACVSLEEARNPDNVLIRRLATQILGYEPDSKQDLEKRKATELKLIEDYENAIEYARRDIASARQRLFEIDAKMGSE